jgi:hypothetical protein
MTHLWLAVQGMVEHSALSGTAGAPHGLGGQRITAWIGDHLVVLLAALAVLLLLGLFRAARRP